MTVIDVSEKKQRQLVAEWKTQQEDSKRRERQREAMEQGREAMEREAVEREKEREAMHPIIAEDEDDIVGQDGEQYIKLRRRGIQKATTGKTTPLYPSTSSCFVCRYIVTIN